MNYRYTIIIPHKNIPDLLKRCLKSIPQDDSIQIVVVDDASENEIELAEVQKDFPYVEFYFEHSALGAGHARNVGLKHALGDWIVFSDADDYFEVDLLNKLDAHYEDKEDIIYFNARSVYSNNLCTSPRLAKRNNNIKKLLNNPSKLYDLCRFFCTEPWGKMIKHRLIKDYNILFDETPLANDFFFSVAAGVYAMSVSFDKSDLYVYTEREGSLSNAYCSNENTLKTRLFVYKKVQDFLDIHNIPYIPFYRFSVWEYRNPNKRFAEIVLDFWKRNGITPKYALFRYVKGKIYQFTTGISL